VNRKEVLEALEQIKYPELDRTIGDLHLIDSYNIENKRLSVVLSVVSDKAFNTLKAVIGDQFGSKFDEVDVHKKMSAPTTAVSDSGSCSTDSGSSCSTSSGSNNYGTTENPNNRAPYAKKIIAVTSGKGGVGKSTVSVNLSVALAQKGFKVGLLDADVYGPNVPRMLQVEEEKLKWEGDKILPSENFGVKIMSVGLTTPEADTPLVWRSSVAVSAVTQFLEDVLWGDLDFLVIDMPPGTGDIQLTMAQELPLSAGVIVTTPQQISVDDVSRAVRMFKDIGVKIGGVVENMSYFIAPDTGKRYDIFGSNGGEKTAKKYDVPLLGQIPLKMEIREGSDSGKPPVALGSDDEKSYYQNIVENLLKEI